MLLDNGKRGTYQPAAKRRVGRGPGGRARRTPIPTKPKTTKDFNPFKEALKDREDARKKSYRKHQGPRGRASKPGARKLKGKAGEMDYDFKLQWGDMVRESRRDETPKMVLKPKTKKGKIKTVPNWVSERNAKYWIANHTV